MLELTFRRIAKGILAIAGGIIVSVNQPSIASANDRVSYTPPTGLPKPQRTQAGGSRGCLNNDPVSLQLLVPKDHTALTVSAHPTFSWYISSIPSMPLELAVVEEGVAQPILVKRLPVKTAGLMQFKLPTDLSGLQIGKEYRWTVSLVCNPERPSQSVNARAWIERSAISTSLNKNLASTSAYDKTLAYIKAGIWYDAIASISESKLTGSDPTVAYSLFNDLLLQIGLKEAGEIKLL